MGINWWNSHGTGCTGDTETGPGQVALPNDEEDGRSRRTEANGAKTMSETGHKNGS